MQKQKDASNQLSDCAKPSAKPVVMETSSNLNLDLSKRLLNLFDSVTQGPMDIAKVSAACNCASEIHKLLRLNFDMKRHGL